MAPVPTDAPTGPCRGLRDKPSATRGLLPEETMQPVRMFHVEWCQKYCTQRGQLYVLQANGNMGMLGFVNARCEKKQWQMDIGPWLRLRGDALPSYVNLQGWPVNKDELKNNSVFLLRSEIPVDKETTEIVMNKVSLSVNPGVYSR